ncbi:MAG: flavodoxin family protein, partial [Methanothrix sp.]|nr:flavodoxin family protein [Methanothrix sp.]
DPLLLQMRAVYTRPDGSSDFAGALLRPMADGMKEMIKAGETGLVEGIFQAAREAGRQLASEGRISEELQAQVSRVLMPRDAYYKAAEMMIQQATTNMAK